MAGQSIYQQGGRWTLSVNVHIQAPLTPHTASITPLLPVDRVTAASCRMMSWRSYGWTALFHYSDIEIWSKYALQLFDFFPFLLKRLMVHNL